MEKYVKELENTFAADITANEKLSIGLGWDPKEESKAATVKGAIEGMILGVSEGTYDLNLAAIVEHDGDKKAELVFHGSGFNSDKSDSVHLGKDDRTGLKHGVNEKISINLAKVPADVNKITLFINITDAKDEKQVLSYIKNAFVLIEGEAHKQYLLEENMFADEEAKSSSTFVFAELVRAEAGWKLNGRSRYSNENSEQETYEALTGKAFTV